MLKTHVTESNRQVRNTNRSCVLLWQKGGSGESNEKKNLDVSTGRVYHTHSVKAVERRGNRQRSWGINIPPEGIRG